MSGDYTQPTFGNWHKPTTAGFGKLTLGTSIGLLVGVIITVILLSQKGLFGALIGLIITGLIYVGFGIKDTHSLSFFDKVLERIMWFKRKTTGDTVFRSGILNGDSAFNLPGKLGRVKIFNAVDAHGKEYALIRQNNGHLSVVFSCSPNGTALVDRSTIDAQVSAWGAWLAHLSNEMGIIGATVTVETVPDNGQRLNRAINDSIDSSAPPVALEVLEGVRASYPTGVSSVRAWVSLTFSASSIGVKQSNSEGVAREIGARLPYLRQSLLATGAGDAVMLKSHDLARLVRCAYDPAAENIFETAYARGEDILLDWSQAGVSEAIVKRDEYIHDGAKSRVWMMTYAPRGSVFDSVLSRLISPHPDIVRKRVTLIFNPISTAKGAEIVDADLRLAMARQTSTKGLNARSAVALRAAKQTADEEASGASLLNFGLLISATVGEHDDLEQASAVVASLAGGSRIGIRPAYGIQDEAFIYTLPLGFIPEMK